MNTARNVFSFEGKLHFSMAFPQIIAAFLALFDAIGLPGNLLVIMTIVLRKNFHVMRYVLLASLAVSDLLFLILVNSFRIGSIAQERWLYGDKMCYLNAFHSRYFYINTVLHLIAVSYDRYDSIVKSPLTYNGTFTKCRVAVIVLIWLIPIGFAISPFLKWGEYVYNPEVFCCQQGWMSQSGASRLRTGMALAFFLVPFLVIALLNWSIYKTAKLKANAVVIQIGSLDGCESHQQENARRRRTERKALDVSIIIAAFVLCFLPTWIVGLCLQIVKSTIIPSEAILVTNCIFTFSSVCNPIIYSIRQRDFRTAVKKTFLRIQIAPQSNPHDIDNSVTGIRSLTCSANHSAVASTSTAVVELANQLQDERLLEGMGRAGVPIPH